MAFIENVLDDFNRANENPLAGNFTPGFQGSFDGVPKIVSNQLVWHSGNVTGAASATWNTFFTPNQFAHIDITTRAGGSSVSLLARVLNPETVNVHGFEVNARTDNSDVQIYRWDSDVNASTLQTISQTLADGDKLGFIIFNDELQAWYKEGSNAWAPIGDPEDVSTYGSIVNSQIGFRISANDAMAADNFGGGNYVDAAPSFSINIVEDLDGDMSGTQATVN